jgi:hypothetical protein
MELFDKRFVYFMWDNELEGKKCFIADGIDDLRGIVEKGNECDLHSVISSGDENAPFESTNGVYVWQFAYYDPNYEAKNAYNKGKPIQVTPKGTDKWLDLHCKPTWDVNLEYRVKPKEKSYRPYESSAEMIADFIARFKVNCPPYCEPLIWVRLKVDKRRRLIVAYGDNFVEIGNKTKAVTLQHLFEQYEFLDGSPVGMEVKKK